MPHVVFVLALIDRAIKPPVNSFAIFLAIFPQGAGITAISEIDSCMMRRFTPGESEYGDK